MVKLAFSTGPHHRQPSRGDIRSQRREKDRLTVARHSTGNILLQQGRFSTREDIDRERDNALTHEF